MWWQQVEASAGALGTPSAASLSPATAASLGTASERALSPATAGSPTTASAASMSPAAECALATAPGASISPASAGHLAPSLSPVTAAYPATVSESAPAAAPEGTLAAASEGAPTAGGSDAPQGAVSLAPSDATAAPTVAYPPAHAHAPAAHPPALAYPPADHPPAVTHSPAAQSPPPRNCAPALSPASACTAALAADLHPRAACALADTHAHVGALRAQVFAQRRELEARRSRLEEQHGRLGEQERFIAEQRGRIAELELQLREVTMEMRGGSEPCRMGERDRLIAEQRGRIAELQKQLHVALALLDARGGRTTACADTGGGGRGKAVTAPLAGGGREVSLGSGEAQLRLEEETVAGFGWRLVGEIPQDERESARTPPMPLAGSAPPLPPNSAPSSERVLFSTRLGLTPQWKDPPLAASPPARTHKQAGSPHTQAGSCRWPHEVYTQDQGQSPSPQSPMLHSPHYPHSPQPPLPQSPQTRWPHLPQPPQSPQHSSMPHSPHYPQSPQPPLPPEPQQLSMPLSPHSPHWPQSPMLHSPQPPLPPSPQQARWPQQPMPQSPQPPLPHSPHARWPQSPQPPPLPHSPHSPHSQQPPLPQSPQTRWPQSPQAPLPQSPQPPLPQSPQLSQPPLPPEPPLSQQPSPQLSQPPLPTQPPLPPEPPPPTQPPLPPSPSPHHSSHPQDPCSPPPLPKAPLPPLPQEQQRRQAPEMALPPPPPPPSMPSNPAPSMPPPPSPPPSTSHRPPPLQPVHPDPPHLEPDVTCKRHADRPRPPGSPPRHGMCSTHLSSHLGAWSPPARAPPSPLSHTPARIPMPPLPPLPETEPTSPEPSSPPHPPTDPIPKDWPPATSLSPEPPATAPSPSPPTTQPSPPPPPLTDHPPPAMPPTTDPCPSTNPDLQPPADSSSPSPRILTGGYASASMVDKQVPPAPVLHSAPTEVPPYVPPFSAPTNVPSFSAPTPPPGTLHVLWSPAVHVLSCSLPPWVHPSASCEEASDTFQGGTHSRAHATAEEASSRSPPLHGRPPATLPPSPPEAGASKNAAHAGAPPQFHGSIVSSAPRGTSSHAPSHAGVPRQPPRPLTAAVRFEEGRGSHTGYCAASQLAAPSGGNAEGGHRSSANNTEGGHRPSASNTEGGHRDLYWPDLHLAGRPVTIPPAHLPPRPTEPAQSAWVSASTRSETVSERIARLTRLLSPHGSDHQRKPEPREHTLSHPHAAPASAYLQADPSQPCAANTLRHKARPPPLQLQRSLSPDVTAAAAPAPPPVSLATVDPPVEGMVSEACAFASGAGGVTSGAMGANGGRCVVQRTGADDPLSAIRRLRMSLNLGSHSQPSPRQPQRERVVNVLSVLVGAPDVASRLADSSAVSAVAWDCSQTATSACAHAPAAPASCEAGVWPPLDSAQQTSAALDRVQSLLAGMSANKASAVSARVLQTPTSQSSSRLADDPFARLGRIVASQRIQHAPPQASPPPHSPHTVWAGASGQSPRPASSLASGISPQAILDAHLSSDARLRVGQLAFREDSSPVPLSLKDDAHSPADCSMAPQPAMEGSAPSAAAPVETKQHAPTPPQCAAGTPFARVAQNLARLHAELARPEAGLASGHSLM